ncbi:MAG: ribulose-phosphate 3-epimerase [Ignavibacteriales bacterium]|nr:ribulose-phosphate 3-epimerase [Ignavibacteriales bacterium]
MKNILIAPSILSADFSALGAAAQAAEKGGADLLHLDVMDGHFVPNITIGPGIVAAISHATKLPLDVHLMIENPERYLEEFQKAGAAYLTVHVEACTHLNRTVSAIRELGMKPGVSVNPSTSLETLSEILPFVDLVLVMSVNPGFGGQKFIQASLDKISRLRLMIGARALSAKIEVDGGVDAANVRSLVDAGTDIIVAGNAVFGSADVGQAIATLRRAALS